MNGTTLPVAAGDILRRTPPGLLNPDGSVPEGAPVYLIQVSSLFGRAAYRRELTEMGVSFPGDAVLRQALRDDVAEIAPANLAQILGWIDQVDEIEEVPQLERGEAEIAELQVLARLLEATVTTVRIAGLRYPKLEASRQWWHDCYPIACGRLFLVGWENGPLGEDGAPVPFVRRGAGPSGRTDDACLAALPDDHLRFIGDAAAAALFLSKALEKNSRPPSQSRTSRRRIATRPKWLRGPKAGKSAAPAGEATPG